MYIEPSFYRGHNKTKLGSKNKENYKSRSNSCQNNKTFFNSTRTPNVLSTHQRPHRLVNMFFMLLLLSIVVAVVYYVTLYPVDNPVPGEYEVVFMSKACLNFNHCFR